MHGFLTRCLCALITILAISSHALSQEATGFDAHYTSASLSMQEQVAGNMLNSDRGRYNLPALTLDPALCRIARIKSEDMRDHHYFAHTSPTYGDVRKMLTAFGYDYNAAGENIAHHATVEKCEAAFLSSPGHRRNIMNKSYKKVGIGIAYDESGFVYLTQIFVR